MKRHGVVEYLNPENLPQNPTFTNVVTVTAPAKTVYVGGQNAVTASDQIVGEGDIATPAEQVFRNLESALGAAGARLEHVINGTSTWWRASHSSRHSGSSSAYGDPDQPASHYAGKGPCAGEARISRRAGGRSRRS